MKKDFKLELKRRISIDENKLIQRDKLLSNQAAYIEGRISAFREVLGILGGEGGKGNIGTEPKPSVLNALTANSLDKIMQCYVYVGWVEAALVEAINELDQILAKNA